MAGTDNEERLDQNTLFLACTRPTMFQGVTLEAFMVNAFFTGIIFLSLKSIFYFSVGIFVHVIFRQICKNDPNAFKILFEFAKTKMRCRTRQFWRASTVSPLRLRRPRLVRELERMEAF
ncbi:type IV secretion system protein VirB3 [Bradyrhizobium brasilense]|uniref:Type IV secretion system protein VirB3 n=1 Tax=Bradyrhizobium brasilense TaxID=1419277 RepID=A0A1G7NNM1_9BRAD|nr:VirB3 family type IV secretion system protein [Bradyrhizobium brasilense]SDF74879.1 type IV secretion system protein VirB3 [Bradyrhizobium brasilense]